MYMYINIYIYCIHICTNLWKQSDRFSWISVKSQWLLEIPSVRSSRYGSPDIRQQKRTFRRPIKPFVSSTNVNLMSLKLQRVHVCVCPTGKGNTCASQNVEKDRRWQESEIANNFSLTASRVCMDFSETKASSLPANTAGCLPLYTEAVHRFRHFKTLQTLRLMCESVPKTTWRQQVFFQRFQRRSGWDCDHGLRVYELFIYKQGLAGRRFLDLERSAASAPDRSGVRWRPCRRVQV